MSDERFDTEYQQKKKRFRLEHTECMQTVKLPTRAESVILRDLENCS